MFVLKRLALNELILGVAEGLHFPMDLKSKVVIVCFWSGLVVGEHSE